LKEYDTFHSFYRIKLEKVATKPSLRLFNLAFKDIGDIAEDVAQELCG
jgi:hypothetical protein